MKYFSFLNWRGPKFSVVENSTLCCLMLHSLRNLCWINDDAGLMRTSSISGRCPGLSFWVHWFWIVGVAWYINHPKILRTYVLKLQIKSSSSSLRSWSILNWPFTQWRWGIYTTSWWYKPRCLFLLFYDLHHHLLLFVLDIYILLTAHFWINFIRMHNGVDFGRIRRLGFGYSI